MTLEIFDRKIIVAFDRMRIQDALALAKKLTGLVWGWRVRLPLLLESYWTIQDLKGLGNVMVDTKCYDIESSMVDDVNKLAGRGVSLATVHASAGTRRIKACVKACEGTKTRLLAVTLLTDFEDEDVMDTYGGFRKQVLPNLLFLAQEAGVHGVVCGLPDIPMLAPPPNLLVCPGFRPPGIAANEQKATGGYEEALKASLVVVGRPITEADDPVEMVEIMNRGFARAEKQQREKAREEDRPVLHGPVAGSPDVPGHSPGVPPDDARDGGAG